MTSTNTCLACSATTAVCSSTASTTCVSGYLLASGACTDACPYGAATCSSLTLATTPLNGFYIDSSDSSRVKTCGF